PFKLNQRKEAQPLLLCEVAMAGLRAHLPPLPDGRGSFISHQRIKFVCRVSHKILDAIGGGNVLAKFPQ
ncbi:MAG: hypothetical protein KAV00_09600, partial [Phycisphaerae bacterium]|nr:hypothetical protein [Phycisphaerae bacterium]